jgi:peptidoglycan hydrolase CwlO-like protein
MNNDKTVERVLDKLDKIEDRLSAIDKTLERNTSSLEYHILRTNQNEQLIKTLKADLEPVENHVRYVQNIFKFLGFVTAVVSFIIGLKKVL